MIYFSAIWFLRKSNLNKCLSKGNERQASRDDQNWDCKEHLHSSVIQAFPSSWLRSISRTQGIWTFYSSATDTHPTLHCNDPAQVHTKVCLFRSGASPSKTKTGRIRKNSNLQSRLNRVRRWAFCIELPWRSLAPFIAWFNQILIS